MKENTIIKTTKTSKPVKNAKAFDLQSLGFTPDIIQDLLPHGMPGRVSGEAHGLYRILTESGERHCRLPGKSLQQMKPIEFPVTGDFVAITEEDIIQKILPRRNLMTRGDEFSAHATEALVANCDVVFVVMSLNQDFHLRKLRWFLIAAESTGQEIVLILTKADLNSDEENHRFIAEARRVTDAPVLLTRMDDPSSVKPILERLNGHRTGVLMGASGVGKSTLINLILGEEHLRTNEIRESDDQGRHTTTHREIIVIQGIGCLIDTPGMRRIRLQDEGEAVDKVFQDLLDLAKMCRYKDCSHTTEPGCAVRAAMAAGTLPESELTDYQNMLQEARHFEMKARVREIHQKKTKQKKKPRQKHWNNEDE